MLNGWHKGERTGSGTIVWKARELLATGAIDDDGFINVLDSESSATCPLGEVGNTAHAIVERVRRVATLSQVLLVRIDVRGE